MKKEKKKSPPFFDFKRQKNARHKITHYGILRYHTVKVNRRIHPYTVSQSDLFTIIQHGRIQQKIGIASVI